MDNTDIAVQWPSWANEAMNDDDIAFVEGYVDTIGWLPSARTEELADFLCISQDRRIWFEMGEDHTLARYKGYRNHPEGGIVGICAGKFNDDGTAIGYAAGVAAALRIHRSELYRDERIRHLESRREIVQSDADRHSASLARDQSELAEIDGKLAKLSILQSD